jgi:CRP-like cAMP-binding protein
VADPSSADLVSARRNRLLNRLTDGELAVLLRVSTETELRLGQVLSEAGHPVETVYFPYTGVVSLVTALEDGSEVEAATVGWEGMAGVTVFLGSDTPTERATVQVGGRGLIMTAAAFELAAGAADGPLYAVMRRYTYTLLTQLARNNACSRLHTLDQRAARWLLTTADRMHSSTFLLTQHFLAQMLAVRRGSVSKVASGLAAEGVITYVRGRITLLDRPRLQSHACSCYGALQLSA